MQLSMMSIQKHDGKLCCISIIIGVFSLSNIYFAFNVNIPTSRALIYSMEISRLLRKSHSSCLYFGWEIWKHVCISILYTRKIVLICYSKCPVNQIAMYRSLY